jgi:hypothetical protein
MIQFKIDKNVPITRRAKWPFQEMEVGDSFAVPSTVPKNTVYSYVSVMTKRLNKRFIARLQADDSVRVWRVE